MQEQTTDPDRPPTTELYASLQAFVHNELKYTSTEVDNALLERFAVARKFNLQAIKQMLRDYVGFKRSLAANGSLSLDWYSSFLFPLQDLYAGGFFHYDKQYHPVYVIFLGKINWEDIFGKYTVDELVLLQIHKIERMFGVVFPAMATLSKRQISKMTVLIDFSDASYFDLVAGKPRQFIERMMHIAQYYYPEILARAYAINISSMFSVIWKLYSLFIDEKTKEKISMHTGRARKRLLQEIDCDKLHAQFGGRANGDVRLNPGPWSDDMEWSFRNRSVTGVKQA